MKPSFESLIQHYEMGEAYKRITEEMGPSPQLTAFVNYMTLTNDSLALEDINYLDHHEQILRDIENANFRQLALESILDKLFTKVKKNKEEDKKIDPSKNVKPSSAEKIHYFSYYEFLIKQFKLIFEYENNVIDKSPSSPDENKWKEFSLLVKKDWLENLNKSLENLDFDMDLSQPVDVDKSEWSDDKVKKQLDLIEKMGSDHLKMLDKLNRKVNSINGWGHEKLEKIGSYINQTMGEPPFGTSITNLREAYSILMKAKSLKF